VEKGADRIELCANMQEGGTTPSYGTILKSLALGKPIVVMIRPKGGNFVYDEEEIDLMKHDIRICKQLGVQEVVFGALKESNQINIEVMRQLIAESQPMDVVFHMAFDSLID
jgi:copper homeostasis protein